MLAFPHRERSPHLRPPSDRSRHPGNRFVR